MRSSRFHVLITWLIFFLASCKITRNVPAGDALYTGATVKIDDSLMGRSEKKNLRSELSSLTRPKPNRRILGMRIPLTAYNIGGWFKKKFGEPPVLLSQLNLDHNIKVLQSTLENQGYFHATVSGDTVVRNKKARAEYTARPGVQYKIAEVEFENDTSGIVQAIRASSSETLLKGGDPFDLELIKGERERIDNYLKEHGYFYFDPDFIIVQVDSTVGENSVNLLVRLKPAIPPQARNQYKINDVYILPNYRLNAAAPDTMKQNAEYYNGYYVIDRRKRFKPKLFSQSMQFDPGDIYNRRDHTETISRLVNLDVFRFVKNRFEPVASVDTPMLNTYYYLTPKPKKSIRAEVNANTKSNNLTGSSISIGWRNRNTFRGGELFSIDATGGFEVQVSGLQRGYNTYRAGVETNLVFPRFVTPFVTITNKGGYVPRTKLLLSYDILNKRKLYTMNSFRAGLGYIWRESLKKEHELNVINITYIQPLDITPLYRDSMQNDPTLQKAVEKQFILGTDYNYTYNELIGERPMSGLYFNGVIDLSGNIAGLVTGANVKEGNPKDIFGARFSQFVKLQSDLRYYIKVSNGTVWANRLIIGAGFPWGNSSELPFIKQFFIGGTNSIRAFRSRSLGPGTYQAPLSKQFLPDQSGDIKLEINTELRPKITNMLYGAVFVDAGNIWLFNENPLKPGAKFSGDFLEELAVGTGVGIRLDINFLVVRLDLAFPIRKPYLAAGDRWVINQVNFGDPDWRRENLVFNLGIGCPF